MFRRGRKKSLAGSQEKRLLIVKLLQAKDILAANTAKNSSNPYAILQLLTESGLESKFSTLHLLIYL